MLSVIEKPSPPDPQCSNHHHRRRRRHHHYVDHHRTTPLSHHLDLSNLPTFSIRDYVSSARSKDIKTSWPFSLKNLQLCVKHSVKDVLPPFQSLDAIRNQVCRRGIGKDDDAVESQPASCRSGESSLLFPSTTTSVCESEIEESVPNNKSYSSAPKALRASGKGKCKLIVKFGSHSDRSSAEDIASNCTTQSEAMASKICPVCKTFSSSSNTTLNAHIDQCLSVESSTPKWTVDSKLSARHRVKPRKTRLMVDIYSTALPCTLEDLDRRNGSNWASGASNFPTPTPEPEPEPESDKLDVGVEGKEAVDEHTSCEDVGAVYIDSNGIKLRILSKSDDAPQLSKVIDHLRPRKPFKGTKFISARKKKRRACKLTHYLKLAQSKKLLSANPPSSQVAGGRGKIHVTEGSYDMLQCDTQNQPNPGNSGTLRQWACSKRTGVAKKLNNKARQKRTWNVSSEYPRIESQQSCFQSSRLGQNQEEELLGLSGNPVSFPDNSNGLEIQVSHVVDQSLGINEAGSSLSVASINGNAERSHTPVKRNARLLRKERTPRDDYCMLKPSKPVATSAPVTGPINIPNRQPSISTKLPRSKALRVSSVRRNMLSGRPVTSKSDIAIKCPDLKKSNMHLRADEEMAPYDLAHNFAANHQSGAEDVHQENPPCRNTGLDSGRNIGVLSLSGRKEAVVSECQQSPFQYHPREREMDNIDSSDLDKVDDGGSVRKDYQCSIDGTTVSQLSSKVVIEETLSSSHKPVDSEMNKIGPLCDVQVLTDASGPSFVGGQEMFYGVQLESDMLMQNVNLGEDLNSGIVHGSSFPDVDPIPIPGPPGSFLPSPRDMGSEDFQGHSSLTSSRVQSSQDQHDFIDGDSSDSPVSTTSTISNSTARRYDLEALPSAVSHAGQDKTRSSFSGGSVDSSMDAAIAARSTSSEAAEGLTFNDEKFKVNKVFLGFKTDIEPCCCQRKERVSHDHTILSSQESQLLKRRVMGSVVLPDAERQMSCNLNTWPSTVEASSDLMFSPSVCLASNSEKAVLPVHPMSQNAWRGATDAGVKFSSRNDCDSVSPSSSNSILRLMGKNLMVVNRDLDDSMTSGQAIPQSQINHPSSSQFAMFTGVSPASVIIQQQPQVYHSFRPNFHQGSAILGQDPYNSVDARPSDGTRTQTVLYQGPGYSYSGQQMDDGFTVPLEPHADYNVPTPQKRFKNHMDGVLPVPDHRCRNNLLSSVKEIITIDDAPESEADLTRDVAKYTGFSTATPFYGCQADGQPLLPESALVQMAGFHSLPSRQANASPVGWPSGCTLDGSGVLQQSQCMATPSSSRGHLRSARYKCQSSLL